MGRWTRSIRNGALALLVAWAAFGILGSYVLTHRFGHPTREDVPEGFASLRLVSADGVRFGAFFALPPLPRGAVVLVHGNGASRSALVDDARTLVEAGFAALPITVRAHGDAEGTTNDIGWGARHDVIAAVAFLRARLPGVPVLVLGKSLGAAAALFAAPSLGHRVRGYVLVAPYADLRLAVQRRAALFLPPGLDRVAYAALLFGSTVTLPTLDRIRPERSARAMPRDIPVLFVTGGADVRAPTSDSRRIAAPLRAARIVEIPGVDHDELVLLGEDARYRAALAEFLDRVVGE